MRKEDKYYIVDKKAVPEVLLKVVEAKRLLLSINIKITFFHFMIIPEVRPLHS